MYTSNCQFCVCVYIYKECECMCISTVPDFQESSSTAHLKVSLKIMFLDSQVAGNNWPLYPKVDHFWFKVAHDYEPLAVQVGSC